MGQTTGNTYKRIPGRLNNLRIDKRIVNQEHQYYSKNVKEAMIHYPAIKTNTDSNSVHYAPRNENQLLLYEFKNFKRQVQRPQKESGPPINKGPNNNQKLGIFHMKSSSDASGSPAWTLDDQKAIDAKELQPRIVQKLEQANQPYQANQGKFGKVEGPFKKLESSMIFTKNTRGRSIY
ncbi:hypothetical protein AYI68_g8121 [Smittium mucronatum]|uniref:Uncharacterized protein n=1 Tax=Smittium mucronatum TaxID=133383 RepID=A0A1R0GLS7_9FUNG|nr:hypothetical protein AYI68_g8121 [Smittium mucronatum]